MSQTVSAELTFIPEAAPHEITSKEEGLALVKRVNRYLNTGPLTRLFSAKLDPHHFPYDPVKETYCVEVTPLIYLRTHWFDKDAKADPELGQPANDWALLREALDNIFAHFRAAFGLVPSLTTVDPKDGSPLHWPGGGCHIHYGADLYWMSSDWYERMKAFHVNLLVDLANRPYVRWLFSQWFADEGSLCTITLSNLKTREAWGTRSPSKITPDAVFRHAMRQSCCIEPRWMVSQKGSYLTFEFRMFSMVENADELRSLVRFVEAWVREVQNRTGKLGVLSDQYAPVTITKAQLVAMGKVRPAKALCREFITSLGLPWSEYLPFFDRHYAVRIRQGVMV